LQRTVILHIGSAASWNAVQDGDYRPASLDSEGFIHCSTRDQAVDVANNVFGGQRGLVLLVIDPARVTSPIRFEDAGNGTLYPHIYGPLNASAVVAVEVFEPGPTGTFRLPDRLA
jgi:uncharacterized protein (DUF952 family)